MRINTNLIALNTKNQLKKNNKTTSNIMEKLSSGKRINKAADDAAGLAISQKMRAQIRGLDQANENVQDGVSLIQTAEGALSEMEAMTQRMRELSVQGANDTLTTEDREKIQKELDALKSQVDVIANTTEFNTKKLLNGDIQSETITETNTETIIEIETEVNSITQLLNLEVPLDGSTVSTSLDIDGETIDLKFVDDLSGNTKVTIENNTDILTNKTLTKVTKGAEIVWEKSYGGSEWENLNKVERTSDGGFIMAGSTYSDDGDISFNNGSYDGWVVKLDSGGNIEWKKTYGGSDQDWYSDIKETSDGGFIMVGGSQSDDGDISLNKGQKDFLITKIDSTGNIEWNKTYGGSFGDDASSVVETAAGNFIVLGNSQSYDGDHLNNHSSDGKLDIWALKLDELGEIIWNKSYGSSGNDYGNNIIETQDDNFLITGTVALADGDVSTINGEQDAWVSKINTDGNILWEKTYGGSDRDALYNLSESSDGGFIISGFTYSTDGDISDNFPGIREGFMIKIDSNGNIELDKSFEDIIEDVKQTLDGGYIILGTSNENSDDYWVTKLDSSGVIEWEDTFGGSDHSMARTIIETKEDEYLISGITRSIDGDISSPKGSYDIWLAQIKESYPIETPTNNMSLIDKELNNNIHLDNINLTFENNKYEKVTGLVVNFSLEKEVTKEIITEIEKTTNGLIIQTGANTGQQMKISVNDMRSEALGMTNGYPKVIPRENAEISIEISDKAIRKLSNERAKLGAKQNRLEHISKNLTNTSENLQNAESRIADADMAKQAMKLAKNDILIQATQSMLAQSNNLPQGVLQLLK